ncbi:hypothetical protein G5B40_14340 [Pikeienuella piscinae]|uniref:Uncharacterized protein n=1 Tax=Pikeienuella piscinae TaxID=2748098 RepID=A0A7L5BZI5_9RHOB|nr:hypothetical protein [Pikeienuella piscinae]QIE56523.1 hypothetical protein G5B40_14340 [Pikeienuella piscinae]
MIVRTSFRCTTCGQNHTVRIGLGHEPYQTHTFQCTGCGEELTVGLRVIKPEGSPIPQFLGEPVENVEQSDEETDAPIVNVDANFLIPLEEKHKDVVFPRITQMQEMMEVAEGHGSLVSFKDFPEKWQNTRPYRPADFGEEWKVLKKSWNLHRNGHTKLSKRKIEEGSAEFYVDEPLKNIQDWLWRFCLLFSQPAFEKPFRDAFKIVQDNREKPEFKAFFKEYENNLAPNRADSYLAIIREFFLAYNDFSQVIFRVKQGLEIDDNAGVNSVQFDKTKMFYGNAFETFSSLVDILAYINNVASGRSFDQFQTLTRKKYLELDKSGRFGPFDGTPALANLCFERDNQLRNASHHASIKLVTPDNRIVYRSGKGGTGPEQELGYAAYLAKCSTLFLQIINLFRFEIMLFEVHGKSYPA